MKGLPKKSSSHMRRTKKSFFAQSVNVTITSGACLNEALICELCISCCAVSGVAMPSKSYLCETDAYLFISIVPEIEHLTPRLTLRER